MKKAVAYLRRSTRGQKLSFDIQRSWIDGFAERNGYEIIHEFCDDKSGRTNDREGFLSAIEFVSQPENSDVFLLCGRICRIARNLGSLHYLEPVLPRIRSANIGDTEINQMLMAVLLAVSKGESDAISARVKQAYKSLKKQNPNAPWGSTAGLPTGREKSLSKRSDRADGYSQGILEALDLIDQDRCLSWKERTRRLNALNIKSPRGGKLYPTTLRRAVLRAEAVRQQPGLF